jgi:hypothetical protein
VGFILLISLQGKTFENVLGFYLAISRGLIKLNPEIWLALLFTIQAVTFRYSYRLQKAVPDRATAQQETKFNSFPPRGCDQQE